MGQSLCNYVDRMETTRHEPELATDHLNDDQLTLLRVFVICFEQHFAFTVCIC